MRCISIWVGVEESSALKRGESRLYIGFRSGTEVGDWLDRVVMGTQWLVCGGIGGYTEGSFHGRWGVGSLKLRRSVGLRRDNGPENENP